MNIEKDVLKELPTKEIYTDLLKPSARRIRKTTEDILKFVSLPFSFLGMTAEELEKKYREFITSALNKVKQFTINKYRDKNEYSLEEHNKDHVDEFDLYKRLSGYTLTGYARDMMELCVSDISDTEDNSISAFVCSTG